MIGATTRRSSVPPVARRLRDLEVVMVFFLHR